MTFLKYDIICENLLACSKLANIIARKQTLMWTKDVFVVLYVQSRGLYRTPQHSTAQQKNSGTNQSDYQSENKKRLMWRISSWGGRERSFFCSNQSQPLCSRWVPWWPPSISSKIFMFIIISQISATKIQWVNIYSILIALSIAILTNWNTAITLFLCLFTSTSWVTSASMLHRFVMLQHCTEIMDLWLTVTKNVQIRDDLYPYA